MKKFALFLSIVTTVHGEILRLSKVAPEPGPGVSRIEAVDDPKKFVHVEDTPIVTEKDVELALPSPSREDSIDVTLTAAGGEKMRVATAKMRPGEDRLAIILNGKVKSAPILQSVPLGKNFVITGLDKESEPLEMAGLISGVSQKTIQMRIYKERQRLANRRKSQTPAFHTDDEYQQLVREREKMGLHYMDRLYTKEELDEILSPGMLPAEIIATFGKPHKIARMEDGGETMEFETAPEKFPLTKVHRMDSFVVRFDQGRLTSWKPYIWSKRTRAPKPRQTSPRPSNLVVKIPPSDMSSEDFEFISFVESYEITLKDDETGPTRADLIELMNALFSLSSASDEAEGIDSKCDIVSILAMKIPEISELAKANQNGKIPLSALGKVIQPYLFKNKPLP